MEFLVAGVASRADNAACKPPTRESARLARCSAWTRLSGLGGWMTLVLVLSIAVLVLDLYRRDTGVSAMRYEDAMESIARK